MSLQPDYPRPNQLWQCGAEGNCPLGATKWGICRATPRCTPRLSLRGRRGVFVAACVFATLGLLLVGLHEPWRNATLDPGPLSGPHTQALAHASEGDRCISCHDAAEADPIAWLAIASGNIGSLAEGQATRCLVCHDRSLGKEYARFAHNVSPEELARTTKRISPHRQSPSDLLRVKFAGKGEVACSTCHWEHHGAQVDITRLTNEQCQTCHVQSFESFASGHPEFRHQLPTRRSRIAFDHVSHLQKHFPGKETQFACSQCHVDDAGSNVKLLASFDVSCAKCHTQPIEAAAIEGLVAFNFPTLNIEQLKAAGEDMGGWPATAQGDFDGALPAAVRALLTGDAEAAAALEQLGPTFDFSQTTSEQLPAVAALAWGYKRLLNDLADDSSATIRQRLTKIASSPPSPERLAVVVRQLPPALFREARRRWLPELAEELAAHDRGGPRPRVATAVLPQVKSELLVENPLAKPQANRDVSVPGITWWSQADQVQPVAGETPLKVTQPPATSATAPGELLAENPLAIGVARERVTAAPPVSSTPPVVESQVLTQPVPPTESVSLSPSEFAASGTWYLDDTTLSVRYRTRGHADELLRLLIDVAANSTHHAVPQHGLLPTMLAESALKSCASCHSIDTAGDHYSINWKSQYRDASRRHFTEFSHRPHLVQPRLADCTACHRLNTASHVTANFETTDPLAHAHDFHPITKVNCASCHSASQSDGRCTLCHSYHVGAIRGNK